MGIIICKEHGRNNIVHVSDILYEFFNNNTKIDTVYLVSFKIDFFGDMPIVTYLSTEDDISNYLAPLNKLKTEENFEKNGSDLAICVKCFHDYLLRYTIKIEEKEILVY